MDNNFPTQHDFTTALVKIRIVSDSMESGLEEILNHIESTTGNTLISKEKMNVLRQSVTTLLECTETLGHISKYVIFPNKDKTS